MRIGIDFGGTNLKIGVFSLDGKTVTFEELKVDELAAGGDFAGRLLEQTLRFAERYPLKGGGLAAKGLVDTHTGIILEDIGAGELLAGLPMRDIFTNRLGIPFIVENDARSYAWGEARFGAGRGFKVVVCLTLGTGLGSALVKDGMPYEGSDPLGGLLGGHISVDRNGPQCVCGNRGCLELYCSATALRRIISERHPELLTDGDPLPDFFESADRIPARRATFNEFLDNLAIGVVNVIHAYGPEAVVLGGGVLNSAAIILPGLIERVGRMAWTFPRGKIKILPSELGNRAAALGVAFHPRLGI
ncbi:MAG: ROK family protein [Candidatus Neomarinimicrobiota bacterium]